MKTLILNGSPRKHGDTASLLEIFRCGMGGEIFQTDAYYAEISPCTDCRFCRTHPACAVKDGMQEIYDLLPECDNIVIASPIYFAEITGKLLDLFSRLQYYYNSRFYRGERITFKPKKGAVILVGGGSWSADRAAETAASLLKEMGASEIHPPVISHNTDRLPAVKDTAATDGVRSIIRFFEQV